MNKIDSECSVSVGRVVKVHKNVAYVERIRSDVCGGCKACILGREGDKLVLPAQNVVNAEVGDEVSFTIPQQRPILAILMLFIIPLVFLLSALFISLLFGVSEVHSILISLCGSGVGFVLVLILDKLIFSKKNATVIKILIKTQQGETYD